MRQPLTMDINDNEGPEGGPRHRWQFASHQPNDVVNLLIASLQVRTQTTLRL